MSDQQPSIGRMVHYVLDSEFKNPGEHRPATIVRIWSGGFVNLLVQIDGGNDDPRYDAANPQLVKWITSVQFDPTATNLRSWHWPEFVPPK